MAFHLEQPQRRGLPQQSSGQSQSTSYSPSPTTSIDPNPRPPFYVAALYPFSGENTSAMSFRQGDVIEVLSMLPSGWWDGIICDGAAVRGWFPSNYVQIISDEEAILARENNRGWWGGEEDESTNFQGRRNTIESANGFVSGVVTDYTTPRAIRSGSLSNPETTSFDDLVGEDLTSFSSGGGIFAEIAEAAAQASSREAGDDFGGGQGARKNGHSTTREDEQDDFWVPKVTNSGQLFYYNMQTGETSRDMPVDGRGDGVFISQDEFPQDASEDDSKSDTGERPALSIDPHWTPKLTSDGAAVYYVNVQTGERTWSPPSSAPLNRSASSDQGFGTTLNPSQTLRASVGGASLLSAWTDRTATNGGDPDVQTLGKANTVRRVSAYSDDSVLDADLARESRRSKGKEVEGSQLEIDEMGVERDGGALNEGTRRKSRQKGKKAVSTTELLEPPPPPLIIDLEALVSGALQELISGAGVAGVVLAPGAAKLDPQVERDRLAALGEAVVGAVRTLLHSAGVLEHLGVAPGTSTFSFPSDPTEPTTALSAQASADLRPYTRRVTSALSKLTFSIRAAWGVLETTAEDQTFDENELPLDDEERDAKREQTLARWADLRERRFELEARQRTEVLVGARDVQISVASFLSEFERIIGEGTSTSGGPPLPRALLRAPKALQGSLRTNAAALLLPGGGFGGNWRGNGFVTLPTPQSTPSMPSGSASPVLPSSLATLGYVYPSKSLTAEVAVALQRDSSPLLAEATALIALIKSLPQSSPNSFGHSPPAVDQLLKQTGGLQRTLANFLTKVEDIDVAANVDYELAGEQVSRPSSRRDFASPTASAPPSGDITKATDDIESMLDPPSSDYRTSVQEARPLLAELEIGKQALYDIAPAMLSALQEQYMPSKSSFLPPTTGAQPLKTSPFESFASPLRVEFGPASVLEVLADLTSAVVRLCSTFTALGAIAEIQAAAPGHVRQRSLALRSSMFEDRTSLSSSSIADSRTADSRTNGKAGPSTSTNTNSTTLSPSSSRRSLARTEDETAEMSSASRDSIDSDYFFSRGPKSSVALISKSAQLFNAGTAWAKRPASVSSVNSREHPRARVSSTDETSPPATTSSRKKNLAKILGEDLPTTAGNKPEPVQRVVPPWLASDYGVDEVSFTPDRQVRGGTLRALVIAACSHEGRVDSNFLSAFLMTYRTFCGSHQLLDLLIQRYSIEPPPGLTLEQNDEWEMRKLNPIRARVANFLKSWVRDHMDHDEFDGDLLRRIAEFASKTMSEGAQAIQIAKAVDDRLKGTAFRQVGNLAPGAVPSSIVPRSFRKLKFTDIDALELARQLTIKDSALFAKITPQECLGKAWPKEYGAEAPNISAMIDMSNAVTRWVTETILAQDDLKKRANIIKHFINVADRCLSLNNFSTLIHIVAGLNSTPIHRLRRTWETVNQRSAAILQGLNNVMRPDKNYKIYREALRGVAPPCVPFLGVYLTDWTFIGDGNPDMLREKPHQINFNKRQKASELILQIKLHQTTTYNLAAVPSLSLWLDQQLFPPGSNLATDDQRLYDISLAREPRERDDEKIARLLSESGFL